MDMSLAKFLCSRMLPFWYPYFYVEHQGLKLTATLQMAGSSIGHKKMLAVTYTIQTKLLSGSLGQPVTENYVGTWGSPWGGFGNHIATVTANRD